MKFFNTILFLSASLTHISDASAGSTQATVITSEFVNRLAMEARANNPSLKAEDSRIRAATLNQEAVRTWEDPTATLGGSVFSSRGFKSDEEGDLLYGVEQKLPLWGRPKLNRLVATALVSMREAETGYRYQQLRNDLTKQLLATALAQYAVEIGEQDLAWLQTTAQATEKKYRAGEGVVADTLEIQNEAAKRNNTLRTEHLELAHARVTLNRLLNRDLGSEWPLLQLPPAAPVIPFSEKLVALALNNEPKLKVLEQEIKSLEAAAVLTRRSRLPEVSLGIQGRQFSGDGEFREGNFTVSISLPWLNEGKYRKDYEREKENKRSAEQDRDDQILTVQEELHHLTLEIETSRREALLYQDEISNRAAQALASRLSDWESGRGALHEVLDAHRTLLESQLTSARAVAQQNQTMAELLLWTGLENFESLTALANEPSLLPNHDHFK
jgi:outer membrane protein TolC